MIDPLTSGFRFYQSANADPETIKEDFIIRLEEFDIIMDDIRRNPMRGSVQHYLVTGRRGSGKSTLLKRLQVEIDEDAVLKQSHIAINLAEEQANIYRLYDLLEEIIDELKDKGIEVAQPDPDDDANSHSRNLFAAIHEAIEKAGKKIVLLLDNIDRVFENLGDDQLLVRELLLNFDDIKVIGGSTKVTEHFWKYDMPFYQFFRILELKPLTIEEIRLLLITWSEKLHLPQLKKFVEERPGQLETVRRLTDGLPRTLQFFVNILINNTQETGYEYLRRIMDMVTPLYQDRLNHLPPAQRRIVLQMAFIWEAAGAREIAAAAHMPNNLISAQIKQLIDKEIAEKIETNTKNNLYRLSERFFNLWLIFTQGSPKEKRKAKCLTVFLENFYDADGLNSLAAHHLEMLKEGKVAGNKLALITKALAQSRYITTGTRDMLIDGTLQLSGIAEDLKKQLPQSSRSIVNEIQELANKQLWKKAIALANTIEQEDGLRENLIGSIYAKAEDDGEAEKYFLQSIQKGNIDAIYNLGLLYGNQGKSEAAEEYYLLAIEKGNVSAINNLGALYDDQGKNEEAEKYYLLAIEKGNANATYNLGLLYAHQGKDEAAEKYFLLAMGKGNVSAIYNLGFLYYNQGKFEEAERYYMQATEKGHVGASNNLGLLYTNQGKYEKAEQYYLLAIREGNVNAMHNLGLLLADQGKYEEAEKYYLLAIEKGLVSAIYNLGLLYDDHGKYEIAEKYYLLSIEKGNADAMNNLSVLYYTRATNKEKALELINKAKELRKNDASATPLWIVINVWNGRIAGMKEELINLLANKQYEYMPLTLQNLLYHYQVNLVSELFEDPEFGAQLRELYQPLYYAVRLLAGQDHNLALKIPPEIKDTVDEILSDVKDKQKFYYPARNKK